MTAGSPYSIRSEAHGPHWIAWIARAGGDKPDKPDRSLVFVGETQEEAEGRARAFAEQTARSSQ
jgi:hypothetical protein